MHYKKKRNGRVFKLTSASACLRSFLSVLAVCHAFLLDCRSEIYKDQKGAAAVGESMSHGSNIWACRRPKDHGKNIGQSHLQRFSNSQRKLAERLRYQWRSNIIAQSLPVDGGLQDTIKSAAIGFDVVDRPFVQILHVSGSLDHSVKRWL